MVITEMIKIYRNILINIAGIDEVLLFNQQFTESIFKENNTIILISFGKVLQRIDRTFLQNTNEEKIETTKHMNIEFYIYNKKKAYNIYDLVDKVLQSFQSYKATKILQDYRIIHPMYPIEELDLSEVSEFANFGKHKIVYQIRYITTNVFGDYEKIDDVDIVSNILE